MAISTQQIKELREATGAGILDCRKALETADGDYEKAVDILREKGLATAAKRADREVNEGVVELYSHGGGRVGVMVEVNCETDFVARSEGFRNFAHEVALQVAAAAPQYMIPDDVPEDVLEREREVARNRAREEGRPEKVWDRIVEGRIKKFYDEITAEPVQEGFYRSPYQVRRMERIKEILGEMLTPESRVLEMGCCDGMLTKWLDSRVGYVLAFDISYPCIKRCNELGLENTEFVRGDLDGMQEHYEMAFDVAVASEVLEHQIDPQAIVKQLGEMAEVILASVPIKEMPNPDAFSVEAFHNPQKAGDGTGHIWCFRPDTFKALFEEVRLYEEIDGTSAIILGR